jgi:DNA-binding IclR family transcriptional regulator
MMAVDKPPAGARAKSAERALAILELLSKGRDGLTFTQIVEATGFPKSSLHELLSVLVGRRFVDLDPDSLRYALGIRMWESGEAFIRQRELVPEARPTLETVAAELNETVHLAVLDGTEIVYLARVDSSRAVRLQSRIGSTMPAHATALGKVLLADLQDQELVRRFEHRALELRTPRTIRTQQDLFGELNRVRALGFAIDNEEAFQDLRCVAVPIRDHRGGVVAAMSASIPVTRATPAGIAAALTHLAAGALDVSWRLGCGVALLALTAVQDPAVAEAAVIQTLRVSDARQSFESAGDGKRP